jgi:hypothetical protein
VSSPLDNLPWRDIGHGVSACQFRYEPDGQLHIAYLHKCSIEGLARHGGLAFAAVPVSDSGTGRDWKLEQLEPLTISPSLLCMSCKHHGFIRDGKWVSA